MIVSFSPEYLHVLVNPLPVYGLGLSILGLLLALISQTRGARVTALTLVFLCTISAWPVYHYGEAAYDRVRATVDDDGGKWLDEHVRRGERLIWVFYVVASLSAIAISAEYISPRWAIPLAITVLILAITGLAVGSYIGYAGGRVRHREFRFEPPPESPAADGK